jgi:hypothetical protein
MGGHQVWDEVLRVGWGVELVVLISGSAFTWEELIAADLPRGDKQAELAMLFRPDCPVEFLRASSFHLVVLADPMLPIAAARKVLKADPAAYEISKLARRGDLSRLELAAAATHGLRRARWYGRRADSYLALDQMPPARLQGFADQHDVEASGMLRHRRCPEAVVLAHVLARSARVRFLALSAAKRRGLTIDPVLLRAARDLPVAEPSDTGIKYSDRIGTLTSELLGAS